MTVPGYPPHPQQPATGLSSLVRAAIWVAIGALIAAAIVCVVWLFVGTQDGIIGRAFLTILLLVAFAGAAILDAHLAPRRPAWLALASMIGWVALLLIGAVMIWLPDRAYLGGFTRVVQFLLIVGIVQLVLVHLRLFLPAARRYVTPFTQTVAVITIALVVALAGLLIAPLMLWEFIDFRDVYGRVIVATAILAAVGTAIVPLVNILFAPKRDHAQPVGAGFPAPQPFPTQPAPFPTPPAPLTAQAEPVLLPWPTYIDGVTALPVMPDGQPDWGAYYTGYPSPGAHVVGPPPAPPAAPTAPAAPPSGHEGYPPPPPLPPR